ncbi:unnamed protein product [Phytomonas sp. Hart1]|nr:unnamed protein product [Phytomonas sp. Hart1]|eukprot:CCW69649.1 unnamed protein product [Phytomonas sp. isolate Hart1]
MRLFLNCARRNNVLSASLGRFFFDLCTLVHRGKCQSGESAMALLGNGDDPGIGPAASPSRPPIQPANAPLYHETALGLWRTFGDALTAKAPFIADKLRHVLEETPEEAHQADTETSSIASTIERVPTAGLCEYDALAVEFSLDLPSPRLPRPGGGGEPPYSLLFGLPGEDGLSEFGPDDDDAGGEGGRNLRDPSTSSVENEEVEEEEESMGSVEAQERDARPPSKYIKKHPRDNDGESDEWMGNEEESFQSRRHRSEESSGSSIAY